MTRDRVVQFRVSVEERERMDTLASQAGVRLSDWVRCRALEEALAPKQATDGSPSAGGLPASPRASVPSMQRARDLLGRDSAAMERQRKMNEAKGL